MKFFRNVFFIIKYLLIGLGIAALFIVFMPERFGLTKTSNTIVANNQTNSTININQVLAKAKAAVVTIRTRSQVYPLASEPCRLSLQRYANDTNSCSFLNNGSGVFIDNSGHIVTNAHVLSFLINGRVFEIASSIIVELNNGQHLSAKVIGLDQDSDIAVLKVDYKPAHYLSLPSKDTTQIGDSVYAIGTPYTSFQQTVTSGIVSAKLFYGVSHYIQTDAGLHPGNSGGALIDTLGNLVGITSLSTREEAGETIYQNFAIAANDVNHLVKQLMQNGSVNRGWLGLNGDMTINLSSISQELQLAEQQITQLKQSIQHLTYGLGIVVTGINANGPADKAGIKQLDIITQVGEQKIYNSTDLIAAIWNLSPGSEVELTYYRDNNKVTSKVILGKRE